MPYTVDSYCHNDLADAATALYSEYLTVNDPAKMPDGFSYDGVAESITISRSVAPTYTYTTYPPSCSTLGYKPWIVAEMADVSLLWGAAASVIVVAWGFKMGKIALKG